MGGWERFTYELTLKLGGMTRQQMLANLDSQELTTWMVLFDVHSEEAEHQRDLAESGDGRVIVTGGEDDEDDEDDEDEPDGEPV